MRSHSVTCHPAEVTFPPLPPAEAGTRFSDPGGMQGWVDLGSWSPTEMRWNKNAVSRASPVAALNRRPTSVSKSKEQGAIALRVSSATGTKTGLWRRILGFFPRNGKFCGASGRMTWGIKVKLSKRRSTDHCHVSCQGASVRPSGRLQSSLVRPVGSLEAGMPAEDNDQQIASFMTLCLTICLQCLQIRPCCPWTSTSASMSNAGAATETQAHGQRHRWVSSRRMKQAVLKASRHCEGQIQPEM